MACKQQANGPHTDFIQEIDMATPVKDSGIKVTDIEAFRDLIEVMSRHEDGLPAEVIEALQAFCDDAVIYDIDYLMKRGVAYDRVLVFVDGIKQGRIVSGHPIGKRVVTMREPDVIADSFWIVCDGRFICGWGEKPEIEVAA